jgi:hypothetical protein
VAHVGGIGAHRGLHGQGRVAGAQGVVFVGDGGTEQGHNAIAKHLVDSALEAVHGVHHVVDGGVEELLGGFRVEAPDEFRRVLEVSKQHGDLLALAFKGGFGCQDFFREIDGGVAARWLGLRSQRRDAGGARGWYEGRATVATKLELGRIGKPALGTRSRQGRAALAAKLQAFGVLKATVRAAHAGALRHSRTSSRDVWAGPVPVPDRRGVDGVSVLQTWPGVKRKARGDTRH